MPITFSGTLTRRVRGRGSVSALVAHGFRSEGLISLLSSLDGAGTANIGGHPSKSIL